MNPNEFKYAMFIATCFGLLFLSILIFKKIANRVEVRLERIEYILTNNICE